MIKIENIEVVGWEHAIRGMRNPMNSWDKYDSGWGFECDCMDKKPAMMEGNLCYVIGENDLNLMKRLRDAGTDHRKYLRMITVYADITAPLYWWKEYDTYKVGTVANSCSTMHKIQAKEFTLDDFSCEYLIPDSLKSLETTVQKLNNLRDRFNKWKNGDEYFTGEQFVDRKVIWYNLIQLLPSSYNQKRTVQLNYEVLANMYKSRKNHKLDEWRDFCEEIKKLPYSELITAEE